MKHLIKHTTILACLLAWSLPAYAADTLIRNARLAADAKHPSALNELPLTDILIRGDLIVDIGPGLEVADNARVIDAGGKPVTAGLFNSHTQLGLREVGAVAPSVDASTQDMRITASLRVADAFNPSSTLIPYNRSLGVTHALIQPANGTNVIAGVASVVRLSDTENIVVERAAMVASLGSLGSELAGGSRAAAMAKLREAVEDARDFARNETSYNSGNRRDYSLSRHDLQALVPVVQRRLPLLVRVDRAADIERVLDFAKAAKLTIILAGVSEGWRVADKIAKAGVPVIFDPINNLPSSYETLGARLDNAALLHRAGVTLLFTGMGWQNTHNAYLVRQSAGNAVANGLPYDAAIAAISSNPARIFGLPDYGSIKQGAKASLVIWSGDPLEVMSNPDLVMIDGKEYSLSSRAKRLRDRYYQRMQSQ